jgi:hypothetical protein
MNAIYIFHACVFVWIILLFVYRFRMVCSSVDTMKPGDNKKRDLL